MIKDYEKTKPRLFIRLLNADKYAADLQDAVYKTLGDIALVLYMKVTEYEGCVTSTKIRPGMLEQWGKDSDEVFKEALEKRCHGKLSEYYEKDKWCSCSIPAGSGRTAGVYAGF